MAPHGGAGSREANRPSCFAGRRAADRRRGGCVVLVDLLSRMARFSWHKTVAVSGALGSGKSEWVLNLARGFQQRGDAPVTIADIDITNPYFCVREIAEELHQKGFRVVTASGEARWGDSPALSAEVKRALAGEGQVLLDVGGDPRGAMALTQLAPNIQETGYDLILVVNAYRPQTQTPEGIVSLCQAISAVGELPVNALVSNAHLMGETAWEHVVHGVQVVEQAADLLGLPLLFAGVDAAVMQKFAAAPETVGDVPLWPLERHILLPWERGGGKNG